MSAKSVHHQEYDDHEEYMFLGEHCSRKDCRQRDFLPIACDRCKMPFCKHHFAYDAHDCPLRDECIVCPLCAQQITISASVAQSALSDPQWADRVVDDHIRTECTGTGGSGMQSNVSLKRIPVARKCAAQRCEKNAIVRCKQCGGMFCVEHRIEGDHECRSRSGSSSSSVFSAAGNAVNRIVSSASGSTVSRPKGFTSAEELRAKYGKKKPTTKSRESGRLVGARHGSDYRSVNKKLGDLHKQRSLTKPTPAAAGSNSNSSSSSSSRGGPSSESSTPKSPAIKVPVPKRTMRVMEKKFSNKIHTAVGQSSIEPEDRFHLGVFFPLRSQVPPLYMFFSRNWKVGKVLDRIAMQGKIVNSNATESDVSKRLNLFNIRTHERIPTDRKLSEVDLAQRDLIILEYGEELSDEVKDAIALAFKNPEKAVAESSSSSCVIS